MSLRPPPAPAWLPDDLTVARANLSRFMADRGFAGYGELHRWSATDRPGFWRAVIERLGIVLRRPYDAVLTGPVETPEWLAGARLNIVDSCFAAAADAVAVVHRERGEIRRATYRDLGHLAARVAGRVAAGDRVAIAMPMTFEAVATYLGIVAAGGVVVSIADSFAPDEIATRLRIAGATRVVTQDRILRGGKELPMYAKVAAAGPAPAVVIPTGGAAALRDGDDWWDDWLAPPGTPLVPVDADPGDHTNVLFSSGTTGDPKAIPWTHTSPIKAAMDGHFHQDVHPEDVVAWPTNLGWMMGPWLIYAALINRAALALYDDVPTGRGFTEFIRDAGVTILGVVPSLVSAWRGGGALDGVDWSALRLFSSTGEASNPDDMRWLMGVAGRPVIEYCGGTEIAGGYITGTVLQPAAPAAFSTPALGIDVRILDAGGRPADLGELFLVPPSIGMSTELLNRDHHDLYFAGVPTADVPLRRHGDQMEALDGGYYRAHGRVDDTMNLGGIKVSSAEIERVVGVVAGVTEVAAVAVPPPGGGPDRLVIFAVPDPGAAPDPGALRTAMQAEIRAHLNPLFKVEEVVLVDALPRTASAKVMRRELRARLAE